MASAALIYLVPTVGTVAFAAWFWRLRTHEERTLRLGLAFLCTVISAVALVEIALVGADTLATRGIAIAIAIVGVMVLLLFPIVLVLTLVISGIRLVRREGARPTNLLSLGLGILLVVYVAVWPWVRAQLEGIPVLGRVLDLIFGLAAVALAVATVAFTLYTVTGLLVQVPHKGRSYHWIVVLGSGLLPNGEVTPLLAHRVEAGVEAWRQNPGATLVMSGGQGPDEARPESVAMRDHALSLGVPAEAILTEEKSTSTEENITFSSKLIASQEATFHHPTSMNQEPLPSDEAEQQQGATAGQAITYDQQASASQAITSSTATHSDTQDRALVVSDDYHVLRALILARKQGFACDGRGSHVRLYFSLNALVREWVAYAVLRKPKYLRLLAVLWIVYVMMWIAEVLAH